MNKDTLSMINQILMDEESLDQLREKLDHEKKQCFPKEKPCKPEREQVTRCYNPVKSQLKPDYAKWCRPLIFTGILLVVGMVLSAIPSLAVFMALLIVADVFLAGVAIIYVFYQRAVIFPKEKRADEDQRRKGQMKNVSEIPGNTKKSAGRWIWSMTENRSFLYNTNIGNSTKGG